jgi:hypothetical protein
VSIRDSWMRYIASRAQRELEQHRVAGEWPRIALIKQDCNEDLYCCAPTAGTLEMLQSTLLRSGPIGLFTMFDSRFLIVRTEPDPECNIWREKWDPLRWCPAEWFEAFRDHVPGRDHGQSRFACSVEEVDWSQFDIVVSVDVSVPARVTGKYPDVVWAYYVREIKAPSYKSSLEAPIAGQDLYLNHQFAPGRRTQKPHVIDFPYHFQYPGVFHEIAERPWPGQVARQGVFVDYHSARNATSQELAMLSEFGPVYACNADDDRIDPVSGERIPERSMSPEGLDALLASKYHVKWKGRSTFGTGKVEVIAAGCLALMDVSGDGTLFMQSRATSFQGFDALIRRLRQLESNDALYCRECRRQQMLVAYLCRDRPANDLIAAWLRIRSRKQR